MSIIETLLVFLGIPAVIYFLVLGAIMAPGMVRASRYRPGQAWNHEPVWYLPHPGAVSHAEVTKPVTASGGASGEW